MFVCKTRHLVLAGGSKVSSIGLPVWEGSLASGAVRMFMGMRAVAG